MTTSIINTNNNSKIIATNNINKIEVNNNNVIQSDSEFREVVKRGYLLSQINLTSIPDIIQDAINEAMLDTKEQTLADALIETLRLSISNLDDGVYKKTYIDNTISYIENLVVSKVSPETVAAIADSKLAIALEGFATTSSVSTLSSRVGNSETEIQNVKQTINTKDTARTLQIEEMEARVNDTFAGYSDAIDLYVDANGNVKSEKIEKLEANNSMATVSINEQNKISLDAQGNYVAFVAKFIADSDGKIVGYNFSDTNDLTTFTINADVFKISNSDNSYTPFTIDGNHILFNGKMTFANVTGTDGIVTTTNMQTVFNSEVTTIDGGKIVTNEAFVNNLNATGGIIAETVTADEFVGKTFTGSIFNGAVINGAVIKASYIDLDGELEVLTNYHITPEMYAMNPSLYADAVYLSGNNEYRIPTISTVKEDTTSVNISSNGAFFNSKIRSYNCANAGHNIKCAKINPTFTCTTDTKIASVSFADYDNLNNANSATISIKIGNFSIGSFKYSAHSYSSTIDNTTDGEESITVYHDGSSVYTFSDNWSSGYLTDNPLVYPNAYIRITVGGINFRLKVNSYFGFSIYLENGTYTIPYNYTNTDISFINIVTSGNNGIVSASTSTSIYINNMI